MLDHFILFTKIYLRLATVNRPPPFRYYSTDRAKTVNISITCVSLYRYFLFVFSISVSFFLWSAISCCGVFAWFLVALIVSAKFIACLFIQLVPCRQFGKEYRNVLHSSVRAALNITVLWFALCILSFCVYSSLYFNF